jgi:GPH family glycoside/pentoside/hexuronide:cation symporter
MTAGEQLGWGRKAGYAVGDFALNLFYAFCTLFLLYYYTDVLGLSPTVAGTIIMVALLFEGVIDPLMGIVANRTRSRFGRYRPYILFGAVPLGLSFVVMFVPTGLSGGALIAYAAAAHLLFRTMYTVVGIPYASLSAEITKNSQQRSQIAGLRMLFAMACAMLLSTATLPLSHRFGGGQTGFFLLSLIYAGAAVPIFLTCFAKTSEAAAAQAARPTMRQIMSMFRANRPLQILLTATVLALIGTTMWSKTLIYYLKYDVGSEALVTPALAVVTGFSALSIPFWTTISGRTSKRDAWLAGASISILNSLIFYVAAPREGPALWIILAISGFANGAIALSFWSMVPDTVEYGEWKTGVRAEGAIYGLVSLIQKLGLGFGIGLLGILLDIAGYRPNMVQHHDTLASMRILLMLVPATLTAIVIMLIWHYPLDHVAHARIGKLIALRRSRATESGQPPCIE